jgi:hypothetical protein
MRDNSQSMPIAAAMAGKPIEPKSSSERNLGVDTRKDGGSSIKQGHAVLPATPVMQSLVLESNPRNSQSMVLNRILVGTLHTVVVISGVLTHEVR